MTKSLQYIIRTLMLTVCVLCAIPVMAEAPIQTVAEAVDVMPIEIVCNGYNLRVKNADGCVIKIFSVTGEVILLQRIEGQSASFDLSNLTKGIYIVKVGKASAVKVYLK